MQTSCCIVHCCCHLPSNFGTYHIFPILHNRPDNFPKIVPFPGDLGPTQ